MALLGPMVVVAESSAADLVEVLAKAGAFPITEARWADMPAAVNEVQPVAVAVADPRGTPAPPHLRAALHCIDARGGPIMPVLALVDQDTRLLIPGALAIGLDDSTERLVARLRSALRVRTLHATVLRTARSEGARKGIPTSVPPGLLDNATVLYVGRGASYPALAMAIGERVGLIGALGIETALHYLNARDVDGVIIGEGLGSRTTETLLTMLAEDTRFSDLPIGLLNNSAIDEERLPNLVRVENDPLLLVERVLPFVRLQAFERRLQRVLKSLESDSGLDPDTGLLGSDAFWRALERAVGARASGSGALSVARFAFEGLNDRRAHVDAARLFSRLLRTDDFACKDDDGSILAVFAGTDLRSAHVLARRIASVLRRTMLSPDADRHTIKPTITLAALRASDDLGTLVARIGAYPRIAAE
jgi:hypothetical protein